MLPDRRETPPADRTPESAAITRRAVLRGGMAIAGGLLVGIDFGRARAGAPGRVDDLACRLVEHAMIVGPQADAYVLAVH